VSLEGKYIIMIAGSESVWLNGEKMSRQRDYIIKDYGDPIIEFTNRHIIKGKDLIVVDFEYIEEDQNYRQNLYGIRGRLNSDFFGLKSPDISEINKIAIFSSRIFDLGASYATESDGEPIIPLSNDDMANLRNNNLNSNGKLLIAPIKRSVAGFDGNLYIGDRTYVSGEVAVSQLDTNTLSIYDNLLEGSAWKLKGSSNTSKLHLNFDLRHLDPNFLPIGAVSSSRNRAVYQQSYDNVSFGDAISGSQGITETSYNTDIQYEPFKYAELSGTLGSMSEFNEEPSSWSRALFWSRALKIALPDLPQINSRYQVTQQENLSKTRESLDISHRLMRKANIRFRNEEIESKYELVAHDKSDVVSTPVRRDSQSTNRLTEGNSRSNTSNISIQTFNLEDVSFSGEYSYESEYTPDDTGAKWLKSSSAQTAAINLSAKPKPWLDFSGYFGRREFIIQPDYSSSSKSNGSSTSPVQRDSQSTKTNVADLKLNLKQLRVNYQIDRKLSTQKEEHYVNYILTTVNGIEEKRYLRAGEGSYVKIDDYTYREDLEKGDYIRLMRSVSDKPVSSAALQAVLSLRQPLQKRKTKINISKIISIYELGIRMDEERDDEFYLLRELQNDKTIYGIRKYWYRTQLSPIKRISISNNWEKSRTLNKRINNRSREAKLDMWNIKLESLLTSDISIGGEFEKNYSKDKISQINTNISVSDYLSDISEQQRSRSFFLRYNPMKVISRLELKGTYQTELDTDTTSEIPSALTKIRSLGAEASFGFRGKGTAIMKYEILLGRSSGELPFTRYDFHEGISHKIRTELSYRLNWFTDVTIRAIYRSEISEDEKPDHRLETEATANF